MEENTISPKPSESPTCNPYCAQVKKCIRHEFPPDFSDQVDQELSILYGIIYGVATFLYESDSEYSDKLSFALTRQCKRVEKLLEKLVDTF
jgi:hypothetical protein